MMASQWKRFSANPTLQPFGESNWKFLKSITILLVTDVFADVNKAKFFPQMSAV
jgi:hypothetical protein